MEPGFYKRVLFKNESSAVTTIEARKSPVKSSTASTKVAAGAKSELLVESYKFTWIVENFSWLTEETTLIGASGGLDYRSAIKSPLFLTGDSQGVSTHHWALLLHPDIDQYSKDSQLRATRYGRSSYIGVHLQLQRPSDELRQVDFTISLLNSLGGIVHFMKKSTLVHSGCLGEAKSRYLAVMSGTLGGCSGWHSFLPRQTLLNASKTFLPDNKLTIRCDMLATYKSAVSSGVAANPSSYKNGWDLVCNLWDMYEHQRGCDVVLRCGKTDFGAHRVVLSARSTVFEMLFESEPSGRDAYDYDIFEMSERTMRLLLDFIYGGDVETLLTPELCREVYPAAATYAIADLMQICTKIMMDSMTVRSVCYVASLAHLHGDQEMLAEVRKFVKANATKVLVSPEWVKLMQRRPELAVKLARV